MVPVIPRFPTILNESPANVSWAVTATLLTGAIATPIISRMADVRGRLQMLLLSMATVLAGSLIAPFGGLAGLIIGRGLQGLGTALVPVAMAVLRDELPEEKVGGSVAFLSATLGIGGGIGIPLGGVISDGLGWQWLFWTSAVLSIASIVAVAIVVPQRPGLASGRFDVAGAVILSVSLLLMLLAISKGSAWGWTSPATLVPLVVGLLVLIAFVPFEARRSSKALVDIQSTRRAPVLLTNTASLLLGFLMFTNLLVTIMQFQGVSAEGGFGKSAAVAGVAMLPSAVIMLVIPSITMMIVRRAGARIALAVGAAITLLTYAGRGFATPEPWALVVWTVIASAGIAIGYAALPILIMSNVPRHETAGANGINALLRAIGTAIASAAVAAAGTTWAVFVNGASQPSFTALAVIFGMGVAVSALTIVMGLAIPSDKKNRD